MKNKKTIIILVLALGVTLAMCSCNGGSQTALRMPINNCRCDGGEDWMTAVTRHFDHSNWKLVDGDSTHVRYMQKDTVYNTKYWGWGPSVVYFNVYRNAKYAFGIATGYDANGKHKVDWFDKGYMPEIIEGEQKQVEKELWIVCEAVWRMRNP